MITSICSRIVVSKSQIDLTPCHGKLTPFTSKLHILFVSCSYFNDLHNNGCAKWSSKKTSFNFKTNKKTSKDFNLYETLNVQSTNCLTPLSTTFLSMITKKKLLELNLDLSLATPKVHKYANEQTFKNSKKGQIFTHCSFVSKI
jgi:hypothetical protein